jgi:hypothetical protein
MTARLAFQSGEYGYGKTRLGGDAVVSPGICSGPANAINSAALGIGRHVLVVASKRRWVRDRGGARGAARADGVVFHL